MPLTSSYINQCPDVAIPLVIDDGYIWTGAYRYSEKSNWQWTDGSSVSGTNWWEGEPNDDGNEDCVIASKRGWNDENCSDQFRFVCQWPICRGRTTRNGACNEKEPYDKIIFRDGYTRNSGEGTCKSPGECSSCKDGFYVNGGYCTSTSFFNKNVGTTYPLKIY
ncbi:unnamed protein product [Mytilus coruscus]|uniref:C-type lectin domain-containing protein n=1 Tax=Mytilus coruscus TaxID=42192 RepID=A0A6J8AP37_MYTCO|nr:unnamed protein product [Mytilus coruscus]